MVINHSTTEPPLAGSYSKISLERLHFWIHTQDTMHSLQQFRFSEKDADEVKGSFVGINLYFLTLTFFAPVFHFLFDFLPFKNINFWKKKKSRTGMFTKAVLWNRVSTVVIFLFLSTEQTSLLVLVPAPVTAVIKLWK